MASTQPRHGDIVIQRRFGANASTHAVKQVYAVTYPATPTKAQSARATTMPSGWRSSWPKRKGSRCGTRRILRREENAGQKFQGDTLTLRVILEPHDDFVALPLTGAPQRIKRQFAEHAHESCCMTRLILLRNRHRTGLVMGAAEAGLRGGRRVNTTARICVDGRQEAARDRQ